MNLTNIDPALIFLLRFIYTMLVIFILSRFIYLYKDRGKREFLISFILISAIVFQVCILLYRIPVELGFALGIFAIFSVIRYRSIPVNPREITYLFLSIGISTKNSIANLDIMYDRIVIADILLLLLAFSAEYFLSKSAKKSKVISYDNLELLAEGRESDLEKDLTSRFNLHRIRNIQIGKIDTIKGRVDLCVTFYDPENKHQTEI